MLMLVLVLVLVLTVFLGEARLSDAAGKKWVAP